jgi:hypothetical protein
MRNSSQLIERNSSLKNSRNALENAETLPKDPFSCKSSSFQGHSGNPRQKGTDSNPACDHNKAGKVWVPPSVEFHCQLGTGCDANY